jgi:hypothetical protein
MSVEEANRCIICLDNQNKVETIMCIKNVDELEKIHCDCNGYCHESCIIEYIENNNNKQDCFICKSKKYSPKYIKKQKLLNKIRRLLIDFYNIIMITLLFILFYFISAYLCQLFKLILGFKVIYNPLDVEFIGEGLILSTIIYLVISYCGNKNSIWAKIVDKWYEKILINYVND